jgi:hypothetical protein
LFVINFSIDSDRDPRRHRAPPGSQLVCSAWGGVPSQAAVVNFLEHHVERVANPTAASTVCPAITADEGTASSCDAVRCDKCFRRNDLISATSLNRSSANARNELPLPGRGEAEQ